MTKEEILRLGGATPHSAATHSLSARLLILTIFFVMLVELFVFPASIAQFQHNYLKNQVEAAHLAFLSVNAAFEPEKQAQAAEQVLNQLSIYQIQAYREGDLSQRIRRYEVPMANEMIDLTADSLWGHMAGAFKVLLMPQHYVLRVMGRPDRDKMMVLTVDVDMLTLRQKMLAHSREVLAISIMISVITAMLVFISIQILMVHPLRSITQSLVRFRRDPENFDHVTIPSKREDEIGIAERELSDMQEDVRASMRQKARLAAIGSAVTKVNHDLRGMLATAQLISDRLSTVNDPEVQQAVPTLFGAIDRAVELCTQTLKYAREGTPPLHKEQFWLIELMQQLEQAFEPITQGKMKITHNVKQQLTVLADRQQLYRVFMNLCKNAFEAGVTEIKITAKRQGTKIVILIKDNGPGLPAHIVEKIFQPFAASTKKGGSGLGLSIAQEIVKAHGGDIFIKDNTDKGLTFEMTIPAPQVALSLSGGFGNSDPAAAAG